MDIVGRFGAHVRKLRRGRGWTQEELAMKAGLTAKFVGQMERGEAAASLRTMEQMANALVLPLHELLQLEEAKSGTDVPGFALSEGELEQVRAALGYLQRVIPTNGNGGEEERNAKLD